MTSVVEKDNRFEKVEDIAVSSHIKVAETVEETVVDGISGPKDIIPIEALSIQDNADHSHDKTTPERQRFDEVTGEASENGGRASTRSSHKYSTRRNLSNMESSLSGTPPSAEGYRDKMMAQWLMNKHWPLGPSFDSESLSEEAQQQRGIARSSALASVGTAFAMTVGRDDNYPQAISIEEDMEAFGEMPATSSKNGC